MDSDDENRSSDKPPRRDSTFNHSFCDCNGVRFVSPRRRRQRSGAWLVLWPVTAGTATDVDAEKSAPTPESPNEAAQQPERFCRSPTVPQPRDSDQDGRCGSAIVPGHSLSIVAPAWESTNQAQQARLSFRG
jgi:hypothetical protein